MNDDGLLYKCFESKLILSSSSPTQSFTVHLHHSILSFHSHNLILLNFSAHALLHSVSSWYCTQINIVIVSKS